MQRDLAAELIGIRRALPAEVAMAVRFGAEPDDGLLAVVPPDPTWRIAILPHDEGWRLTEVHELPHPMTGQSVELGTVSTAEAPAVIAGHFRRRQLLLRNAACGAPLEEQVVGRTPRVGT